MTQYLLQTRWSVSRGRDTYGYNICSLYVDGKKVASCNGGGYDMEGTVIGDWLMFAFQDRLLKYCRENFPEGKTSGQPFSGVSYYTVESHGKESVHCDGAAGKNAMENIASAIGIKFQWKGETKNSSNWIVTDTLGE